MIIHRSISDFLENGFSRDQLFLLFMTFRYILKENDIFSIYFCIKLIFSAVYRKPHLFNKSHFFLFKNKEKD